MRTLAVGIVVTWVMGCGTKSEDAPPANTPDTAGGDTAVVEDTAAPVDTTVTEDTTPPPVDEGKTEDTSKPDTAKADTNTTPPDGKTGSPCTTDADCIADTHLCFSGFCAAKCRDKDGPIEGACDEVSEASAWGTKFECPSDFIVCTPGDVADKAVACKANADCAGFGDAVCAGAVGTGGAHVGGICLPKGDRAAQGAACTDSGECASLSCLGADAATGKEGICADHCVNNKQCGGGHICEGIGFITEEGSTLPGAWGGFCIPTEGSLKYCAKQSACPEGEVCNASIEPTTLGAQYHCITAQAGGKAAGEECAQATDCSSGFCLKFPAGGKSYCSNACQKDPADCPAAMSCGSLILHQNGTPDDPDDDKLLGTCVFGAAGDGCTVAGDFCSGDLQCVAGKDDTEGFGTCTSVAPCEEGKPCDDGDACTSGDTCTGGKCVSGKAVAGCCKTSADCDDKNKCNGDEDCKSNACSPGNALDCDDKDTCTDDSCDPTDGCKNIDNGSCTKAPTYEADVQPLFKKYCTPCHDGGGKGGHNIAQSYADTQKDSKVCPDPAKVGECAYIRIHDWKDMPEGAGPKPTDADMAVIKAWIDGGMLEK